MNYHTDYVLETRLPDEVEAFLNTLPSPASATLVKAFPRSIRRPFKTIMGGYILRIHADSVSVLAALSRRSLGLVVGKLCATCKVSILDRNDVCFVCSTRNSRVQSLKGSRSLKSTQNKVSKALDNPHV
jgi:hypothetical protein